MQTGDKKQSAGSKENKEEDLYKQKKEEDIFENAQEMQEAKKFYRAKLKKKATAKEEDLKKQAEVAKVEKQLHEVFTVMDQSQFAAAVSYVADQIYDKDPEESNKLRVLGANKGKYIDRVKVKIAACAPELLAGVMSFKKKPPLEVEEAPIQEIIRAVRDIDDFVEMYKNVLGYYLPKKKHIDLDFVTEYFQGTKSLFKREQIKYMKPPRFEEFTIEKGLELAKKSVEVSMFLPKKCPGRTYLFTILNTVFPGSIARAVQEAYSIRNERDEAVQSHVLMTKDRLEEFKEAAKSFHPKGSARRAGLFRIGKEKRIEARTHPKHVQLPGVSLMSDRTLLEFPAKKQKPDRVKRVLKHISWKEVHK